MKDEASVKYITALAAKSEFVTAVTGGESLPPQSTHPNNAGEAVRDASAALSRTSISDGTLAIHPSRLITAMMNMTTGARAGRVQAALADDGRTVAVSRTNVTHTSVTDGTVSRFARMVPPPAAPDGDIYSTVQYQRRSEGPQGEQGMQAATCSAVAGCPLDLCPQER